MRGSAQATLLADLESFQARIMTVEAALQKLHYVSTEQRI